MNIQPEFLIISTSKWNALVQSTYYVTVKNSKLKPTVFWDIVRCSLIEVDQGFRGVYNLHHEDYEYSLLLNKTTQQYISEGYHIYTCCREKLKSE